jgi:CheY-like chemotaxis protein
MVNTLLDLSALRFLIVDDSVEMRSLLVNMLFSLGGHNVLEASDGADALEIMGVNHVDVVLTDWKMTPVDGMDFTRHVRTDPASRFQMVPIIMISGYTEARHVAQARNVGVTEFLAKPVSPIALYQRIEEVILRPRQFVRTKTYTGPDRHRHDNENYFGPLRRDEDEELKSTRKEKNKAHPQETPDQGDREA